MFLLYVIFFFLILRFSVTLFNFISNPKLTPSGKHFDDLVSILIPVNHHKDEILTLLESIRAQEYKNYEVFILENPSDNGIKKSWEDVFGNDRRFHFIDLPSPPAGWTVKNFSYYQLSKQAMGKYLLFLDPRSILAKGLINNTVHRMKIQRLALLSLFSNQIMLNLGERMVIPLINYLLLNLVPLRLIRLSKNPVFAVTSGQFMMFDAENYKAHDWHQKVKSKSNGDVELMRMLKSYGYHAEVLLANGFLYSRLYTGFVSSIQGLSKSIIGNFGSITALFIYIFMVIIGPVAVATYMGTQLLLFAITLILLSRIMISLASGQNPWLNALFHPLQMLSLLLISALSVPSHFFKSLNRGR